FSSGYNIGAPEVESALNQHDESLETAVIARRDPNRGSIACGFVALVDGVRRSEADAKGLQYCVRATIDRFEYRREIISGDELPHNPSGKLQHFKLRDALNADSLS